MLGRLVTLATFDNAMQAALVKNHLEAEGIRCALADEFAVSNFWHLSNAIGGIKLQVPEEDLERSAAILDAIDQRHRSRADVDEDSEPVYQGHNPANEKKAADIEPKPGADEEEEEPPLNVREDNVERAYRAVLVVYMFLPLQLYATWVLLDVWQSDLPLRPAVYAKLKWAIGLHLPMVAIAVVVILFALRGVLSPGLPSL